MLGRAPTQRAHSIVAMCAGSVAHAGRAVSTSAQAMCSFLAASSAWPVLLEYSSLLNRASQTVVVIANIGQNPLSQHLVFVCRVFDQPLSKPCLVRNDFPEISWGRPKYHCCPVQFYEAALGAFDGLFVPLQGG